MKKTSGYLRWPAIGLCVLLSCIAFALTDAESLLPAEGSLSFRAVFSAIYSATERVGMQATLSAVLLAALYNKTLFRGKADRPALALSCLLGFFLTLGVSFRQFSSIAYFTASANQLCIALLTWGGCWICLYALCKWLFERISRFQPAPGILVSRLTPGKAHLLAMLLLLACWLPLILTHFPGSVDTDSSVQLAMYSGRMAMDTRHSWAGTVLLGMLWRCGTALLGSSYGIALLTGLQTLLAAAVFGGVCACASRRLGRGFGWAFLCFYGFTPVWWSYLQCSCKDTLFFVAFAWLLLTAFRLSLGEHGRSAYLQLIISAVLTAILRNNGTVVAVPLLVMLICRVKEKKPRIRAAAVSAVALAFILLLNVVLVQLNHIPSYSVFESRSVQLQQVARCVKEKGDELTEQDREDISAVLPYDRLADAYKPELSDRIKNLVLDRLPDDETLQRFNRVWLSLLQRYPVTCLNALLGQCYEYLAPFDVSMELGLFLFYTDGMDGEPFAVYAFSEDTRTMAQALAYAWNRLPLLQLLMMPGIYFWALLFLLTLLLRRRQTVGLLPVCLLLCYNIGCMFSPVNGYIRYMLPIMAALPIAVIPVLGPDRPLPKTA